MSALQCIVAAFAVIIAIAGFSMFGTIFIIELKKLFK